MKDRGVSEEVRRKIKEDEDGKGVRFRPRRGGSQSPGDRGVNGCGEEGTGWNWLLPKQCFPAQQMHHVPLEMV